MSQPMPEQQPPLAHARARLARHVHWARQDGLARLIEEDRLDPRDRAAEAVRRWRYRRTNPQPPGQATAVFLVGVQRSGTNMAVRGLEQDPRFEVHNESDRRVFHRFRLRSDDVVRTVVERSRHPYVLFKPLCDAHRTDHLLDGLGLSRPPKAIWAYRSVDGRVRSAVAKFGDVNRRVLAQIAAGQALDSWQAQGISPETMDLLRRLDPASLSPESAAAVFWLVRNTLLFEQRLDGRDDVLVVSYESFVADPAGTMHPLCDFLGFPYDDRLVAHIDRRAAGSGSRLELDPRVRAACDALTERLDAAASRHRLRAA
jgi:Sulfotransferase family